MLKKEMARTRVAMRNEKAPKKKGGKRKKKRGGLKFDPMRCDQLPCPVAPRTHSHSHSHSLTLTNEPVAVIDGVAGLIRGPVAVHLDRELDEEVALRS